jgi:hypothetical protein
MTYYVPKRRMSMFVDFTDTDGNDYFKERDRLNSLGGDNDDAKSKTRMRVGDAVSWMMYDPNKIVVIYFLYIHFVIF